MSSKIGKVISIVVVLLLVLSVGGAVAYFTDGFTSDFKSFYVECGGKEVVSNGGGYLVSKDLPLSVDVKYTFGFLSEQTSGCTAKVLPLVREGNDFDFTLDGSVYSFFAESDLTKGFNIAYKDNSFTLTPKGNIQEIFSAIYPDNKVEIDTKTVDFTKDMFTLVVTSYNGKSSINLNFTIENIIGAKGITLDKEAVII